VYYVGVPLAQGKTVKYVTVPDISQSVATGQVAMHIFAASIG
jgi:beta-glucosidase